MDRVSLNNAFDKGIRKVAWWWLPLCIISGIVLLNQNWLPKYVMTQFPEWQEFDVYFDAYSEFQREYLMNVLDLGLIEKFIEKLIYITSQEHMKQVIAQFLTKVVVLGGVLSIVGCFLYVIMIMVAKSAVFDKGTASLKDDSHKTLGATMSFLFLAVVKAFCMIIFIPGIYFYVRLMFTGIVITEDSANPIEAIKTSWRLTGHDVSSLFLLFIIEFCLNIVAGITVVGVIPVPPMKYTMRTAVYQQLKEYENEQGIS